MAALSDADRKAIYAAFMRESSSDHDHLGDMVKADLRAIVNAVDQWIDDNQTSFNNALPEPGKTELTTKQKVKIFVEVAERRWEVS